MLSAIPLYRTIDEYNLNINIPLPRYPDFDVRDFEQNMKTVRLEMPSFRHNFYQVALLESGGGTVTSAGQAFDLDNFTIFFIQPGQINYWNIPKDWRGYYFSISESFYTVPLDGFRSLSEFPFFQKFTQGFKLKREEAKVILELFERINQEYHSPSMFNQAIIKSYVCSILGYCIRFYERGRDDERVEKSKLGLVDHFQKLLRDYGQEVGSGLITDHKSVTDFANELAISSKHLSEVIKKSTGQSPIEHINQVLIDEAKKLLITTDMAIKELGYYLGFSSPSYFTRLFKQYTGSSPAQFRKA